MRALIAEITAENLELNKRFAVGRFVPSASGDESDNDFGNNYLQAEAIIATLMHHYNEERLHATVGDVTPATRHRQPDEVQSERARRIAAARAHRSMANQQRFTEAAGSLPDPRDRICMSLGTDPIPPQ